MHRTWIAAIAGIWMTGLLWAPQPAKAEDVVVFVGPTSLVGDLSLADVSAAYLGKTVYLDGVRLTPAMYAAPQAMRARFLKDVVGVSDAVYDGMWIGHQFRDTGDRPVTYQTVRQMRQHVQRNPGGIGFVYGSIFEGMSGVREVFRMTLPELTADEGGTRR